jgi:tetratricopeptide (TPR) repeat protein
MNGRSAAALAALLLATGCGGKAPVVPESESAATRWDQRGHEAAARGDHGAATDAFRQALAAYRSIENVDGIAVELMNLAASQHRLGAADAAAAALDEILRGDGLSFSDVARAEAAYRRALFAFEDGRTAQVEPWLGRATTFCAPSNCAAAGRVSNLRARLALVSGDRAGAIAAARSGLDANRKQGDVIEEANSLRLLGDAHFAAGETTPAQGFFAQALELDKRAGAATKIALDLLGLGRCALKAGDKTAAREYFRRALSVSDGVGDGQGREAAETLLKATAP